jgi:tRNA threonylcarbamoyladenosine biosynthesis protein TsaE
MALADVAEGFGSGYKRNMVVVLTLADEAATRNLARRLAQAAESGDVIALYGDLGAGKTALARAFIQALAGEDEDVPSPTFTLVQLYECEAGTIWHFDLYRLEKPEEALELGIEEAFADGVSLIEWPDRLGSWLPTGRLDLRLAAGASEGARRAELTAQGGRWATKLRELFGE